ncbi:hypothetical protein MSG28_007620 [Choristoneura fumiferana]|uniref:Uncharacterized protein n=2 Tax=Choristoneura fumiferana TaxID=7141 RepID=A0ACC0JYL1_CHOFU|nr:hypothetical protein MSG28_007620 [Choristoneura fumiferana]KAI8429051.1 hypothetical protein MSG28_007620 [Choristoneura fumiferana]
MFRNYCLLFILFLNFQHFTADVSFLSYPFSTGDILHHSEKCATLLHTFAQSASNLTMCSILYARPVRLCGECVNEYVNFELDYNELLETVDNGTSCKSIFMSRDRLDSVLEFHNGIVGIWEKGNCINCFEWDGAIPTISNDTKKFNKMYNETMECILDNLNQFGNNTDAVCEKCYELYVGLDEFYKTLSPDGIGVETVCMDVVDLMNTTRSVWSKNLDCCKLRRAPEVVFLCCTAVISILPVLFYLAMRYCGPIRDLPDVLKQSRFSQRFKRSVNGRLN